MAKRLRVVFENPGWFLVDGTVVVALDGKELFQGSFKSGFDRTVDAESGHHTLKAAISIGPVRRTREYMFRLGAERSYVAELHYSRILGNFSGGMSVEPEETSGEE